MEPRAKVNSINVLITSVSKKVWLVKLFKDAIKSLGLKGLVVSVDMDPMSAGFYASDKHYLVPPATSKEFIPKLLQICQQEKIKLLVPTRDGELIIFAESKRLFESEGVTVLVSDKSVIEICRDKYRFWQFLNKNGFVSPATFLPEELDYSSLKYPLIIKPRCGSAGKGTFKATNEEELRFFIKYVSDAVVQEFIEGKEYTIDVLSNFKGNVLTVVPRERIEVVSGESFKGRTVKDQRLIGSAQSLVEKLGIIGHVTVQCIINANKITFLEVNPRFGGGAALGVVAGACTPALILKLVLGEKVEPQVGKFKDKLLMLRYTDNFFVDEKNLSGH